MVIDEIQRQPELYEVIRVLVDKPDCKARFLLLGSAAPRLVKEISETLAGRVGFVYLSGFNLEELGPEQALSLWLRGISTSLRDST